MKKIPASRPVLAMVGLGLDFPAQATLEVLEVLSASEVIVNNLYGTNALEFLSMFGKKMHTISYQGSDPEVWTDQAFSFLKPGKLVTFVTRGHPLVSGHLAIAMLKRARKEGVEIRSYSAISTFDEMLSIAQEVLGETIFGLQVHHVMPEAADRVPLFPDVPALLYLGIDPDGGPRAVELVSRLCARLATIYPSGHRVHVYRAPYEKRQFDTHPLSELKGRLEGLDPRTLSSLVLYLSAVPGSDPRAR